MDATYIALIQKAYDATNDVFFSCGESCIAFRGTEDLADVCADLGAVKIAYDLPMGSYRIPVGNVHAGFYRRWQDIRASAFAAVSEPGPITIVGHSLGGAMAILCAVEMQVRGWQVNLVTYGCPRVGDSEFSRMVDVNIPNYTRVENWADPVTWLPRVMGWSHAGKTRRVGSMANFWRFPLSQHHRMASYRKALGI